jgi:hypothetical protein
MHKILIYIVVFTLLPGLTTSLTLDVLRTDAQELSPKLDPNLEPILDVRDELPSLVAIQPLARPTPVPLVIPPPADPGQTRLIILGGVIAAIVVVVGVWINRRLVT